MKNLIKMDDLGGPPLFSETLTYKSVRTYTNVIHAVHGGVGSLSQPLRLELEQCSSCLARFAT